MTMTLPISAKGIIFENDSVWLRKNERNEWELPGGKVEENEQPAETVTRELSEELGFAVDISQLIDAHIYSLVVAKSPDESHGVLVLSYLCKLISKTGEFEHAGEAGHAEFQRFPKDEIASLNMPQFYKDAIHKSSQINF